MRRFILFAILFLWCLSLCVAEPGKNSRLRAQRKKEAKEREAEADRWLLLNSGYETKYQHESEEPRSVTVAEYWKNRTDDAADSANLVVALTRLNTISLQQSYSFLVNEFKDGVLRRKSACRDAIGRNGRQTGYFKCLDISDWGYSGYEEYTEDDELAFAQRITKSISVENPDDGSIREATEVTMQAKFFLRHWRNLDVTFRFAEGETEPIKLRRKDWSCRADESFDDIICEWSPEDTEMSRIEPYYWHP